MPFKKRIKIGDFTVSERSGTFIIAEAGVNHNGDMGIAKKLVDCAALAGCNAVKFQAFKTERLILLSDVPKAPYQLKTTGSGESQFDMLKKLELTVDESARLKRYCEKKGIMFLMTPFDEQSLEELDDFNLPAYKVASTDITNLLFLKKIAKKKKPLILSTGMAYLSEVERALSEIAPFNKEIILMQCTANYPIEAEEANLDVIRTYRNKFDILVGYSDHSAGIGAAPYAVALGAKAVEKHFTLDRNFEGPDHKASLEPGELEEFVREIRRAESYLGCGDKAPTKSEFSTRKTLQKHLIAARGIRKGEVFNENNITAKRTGGRGLSPLNYRDVIGKTAGRDYAADEIINP